MQTSRVRHRSWWTLELGDNNLPAACSPSEGPNHPSPSHSFCPQFLELYPGGQPKSSTQLWQPACWNLPGSQAPALTETTPHPRSARGLYPHTPPAESPPVPKEQWLGCTTPCGSEITMRFRLWVPVSQGCTPCGEPFQGAGLKFHASDIAIFRLENQCHKDTLRTTRNVVGLPSDTPYFNVSVHYKNLKRSSVSHRDSTYYSQVMWNLYARRQPVKGTGQNKKKLHLVHGNTLQVRSGLHANGGPVLGRRRKMR